jgi:hypothetical protein
LTDSFGLQEWAYDSSRLCFLPEGETFRVHIVDPAIKLLPLIQFATFHFKVENQKVDDWKNWPPEKNPELPESVSILKFGDLDGLVLKFNKSIARPFKRVLCFQAKMCNVTARRKSWSTEEWDVPDFWSEGDYQATVKSWLAHL